MKKLFLALISVFFLLSCDENENLSTAEQDALDFARQITGVWALETTTIVPVAKSAPESITIPSVTACSKLANDFENRDVVNEFEIRLENNVLKVFKRYTCSLPPEQLSWRIETENTVDFERNWMTGKVFTIKEINEASVQAIYSIIFFNLNNPSPDGKHADSRTSNKLWLDVKYDVKESSKDFRLELRKVE
jgi:hypothetical protein